MGPERGGLKNDDKSVVVLSAIHRIGGELLHSPGQRNRRRARPDLFRPFAMLEPAVTEGVRVRWNIRPNETNQISIGADFSSLKTYQRCSAGEPCHEAIGRRNR